MKTQIRTNKPHYHYIAIFMTGALLYLAAVLPFLIYHGGIFFYYGDYNVQQVPFYVLANRAVHDKNFFWNPRVDLGSNMGGAFAFYLWGSPFFWLSTLFPEKWVPYLLPFLMSLKYGTALTCAFAYFRTMVKTDRAALFGALLYAFSGCQAVNIVFQHMHDASAFFPLYLYAFDRFVQGTAANASCVLSSIPLLSENKRRRGSFVIYRLPFVLMTALSSVVNYYFFFGQVIFLILYYLLRYVAGTGRKAGEVFRQILSLIAHGALGLALSAFFLVQVVAILSGNARIADVLAGYDMIAYKEPTTPFAIVKSMFMVPDIIGRGTLFTNDQVKNSSLSVYIPGFALSGAIAMLRRERGRRSFLRRLFIASLIIAFVPALNAVFSAMNAEYYARWFYMPVLFLALATAMELERGDKEELGFGLGVSSLAFLVFILLSFLPARSEDGYLSWFSLLEYPRLFYVEVLATAIALILAAIIVFFPAGAERIRDTKAEEKEGAARGKVRFRSVAAYILRLRPRTFHGTASGLVTRRALILTMLICVVTTVGVVFNGNSLIARSGGTKWRQQMLDNVPVLPDYDANDGSWTRVEADGTSTNYEMVWGYPTLHCFESTVTPSIVEFYKGIGVSRTVDSKMNFSHVGARYLLSLRYYLENSIIHQDETYDDKGGLAGFELAGESNGYNIYENQHYIPMGFTFDSYMTEEDYEAIDNDTAQDRLLVKDLILNEETAAQYGHLLTRDTGTERIQLSKEELERQADERAATSCTAFAFDNQGFTATTADLPKENLLFLSVPYDKGFTAYIDGKETDILRADWGLMAVDVPEGSHEIRFTYLPYGFRISCVISLSALAFIILLSVVTRNTISGTR